MTLLDGFKLEVAFSSGPYDAAPTWTDITSYWVQSQQTTIDRGRQSEVDVVQPSTLALTLDNTDGRFTVGNTASPYYPNVKLRKQIRVSYTENATVYVRFKGYVDEWPTAWPTGDDTYAWAQVRASDRFKPLGTKRVLRSVPQEEILYAGATSYYPLGEPQGATQAVDIAGYGTSFLTVGQVGNGGTITFGTGTGPPTDASPACQFSAVDANNGKYLVGTFPSFSQPPGVTLLATFNTTSTGVGVVTIYDTGFVRLWINASGQVTGVVQDAIGHSATVSDTKSSADGKTHSAAVTVTPGGSITVYVDGVSVGSAAWGYSIPTASAIWVGSLIGGSGPFTGTLSHVAMFSTIALSATSVARIYTALTTGFAGESTGARVGRVADWCKIASGDRSIDTGGTTSLRHVDTTGKTAAGYLQELANTEAGLVFVNTAGQLRFQQRGARIDQSAALTLSASAQQIDEGVVYRATDQFVLNDVTYWRASGITYRSIDTTSIGDYGTTAANTETYTTSDDEVRSHAVFVVYMSKTPIARIEGLGVDLLTGLQSVRLAALGLDLSSMVAVQNMPTAAPAASTTVFVEGYRETISTSEWSLSMNTSPADLYSPWWQLGTAGFSELESTTRLNF